MPIPGMHFDLLGVTLARVGPIDTPVHVELDRGVTALYGVNGAGKSQILKYVIDALRGICPEPQRYDGEPTPNLLDVHVRLHTDNPLGPRWPVTLDHLRREIVRDLRRMHEDLPPDRVTQVQPFEQIADLLRSLVATGDELELHRAAIRFGKRQADGLERAEMLEQLRREQARWSPALEEAAGNGRLTFRAVGSPESPRWEVYLASSPSDKQGASALGEADKDNATRRAQAAVGLRPSGPRPPFESSYWGTARSPQSSNDLPPNLQVPTLRIGEVMAERWYEEVQRFGGTTRRIRDVEFGMVLATICGDVPGSRGPDAQTMAALEYASGNYEEGLLDHESATFSAEVEPEKTRREVLATDLIGCLLPDPPRLTFDMMRPEDWLRGVPPRWRANRWDLDHLSQAQRRWVELSVSMANARCSNRHVIEESDEAPTNTAPILFVCDEPEAGLHRAVEHRLGRALLEMGHLTGAGLLVATHSPELLGSPLVSTSFVTRNAADEVVLRPVSMSVTDGVSIRDSAADLGLTAGDLWAMARVSVVVEGVHDEWVFKNVLRDELDHALAGILPMHGGTRLRSLAEARLLTDGTDAQILVVLDDLALDLANQTLAKITAAAEVGDPESLRVALEELRSLGKTNDSFLFLHQFALRAAEIQRLDRIQVHGLSLPDVICYLDPDTILTENRSWDELIAEWKLDAAPHPPKNIKGWLKQKGLLPGDPRAIDEAVERAAMQLRLEGRDVHQDLVALGLRIVDLGHGNRHAQDQ